MADSVGDVSEPELEEKLDDGQRVEDSSEEDVDEEANLKFASSMFGVDGAQQAKAKAKAAVAKGPRTLASVSSGTLRSVTGGSACSKPTVVMPPSTAGTVPGMTPQKQHRQGAKLAGPAASLPSSPRDSADGAAKQGAGRATFMSKMSGKEPGEILGPSGLDKIKVTWSEIMKAFAQEPFTCANLAGQCEAHSQKLVEIKKSTAIMQRATVALDIKIGKWKTVPEDVQFELKKWRNQEIIPRLINYAACLELHAHQGP